LEHLRVEIEKFIDKHQLRDYQKSLLVALSGGADSVALLRLLLDAGIRCHAAHCNFHLRGAESDRDAQFVADLCKKWNVPLYVRDFDVAAYQREHGGSVEMACRELRYAWFEALRAGHDFAYVAVAHHRDDQVETFFLNLLRGTSSRGLAGMRPVNGHIIRPLLTVSRHEIEQYLQAIGQDYVTDSTNLQSDYARNRLRNVVLPALCSQFPDAPDRIAADMARIADDNALADELLAKRFPDSLHFDGEALLQLETAAVALRRLTRRWNFSPRQCEDAISDLRAQRYGNRYLTALATMHVGRKGIEIEETADSRQTPVEVPVDLRGDILSPCRITISRNNPPFSPAFCDGKGVIALSADVLRCRKIVLRPWRDGDRIKPFGMTGSKLVSDLFTDLKMDAPEKQAAWLLEADGQVLWVVGCRASRLYAVAPESQDYLLLRYAGTKKKTHNQKKNS